MEEINPEPETRKTSFLNLTAVSKLIPTKSSIQQGSLAMKNVTNLQHLSQKNLSSAFKVSVELKFFRQLVMELFCSISRLKSRNVSSLAVTVSQRKHLVSFVNIP